MRMRISDFLGERVSAGLPAAAPVQTTLSSAAAGKVEDVTSFVSTCNCGAAGGERR